MPDFEIDLSLPAFDFYEGADLTALGRPLKTDKQITPPLINAAPLWDGYMIIMWEEIRDLASFFLTSFRQNPKRRHYCNSADPLGAGRL